MEDFLTRAPDVEVSFEFNGVKTRAVTNGYRPAHLINENYLTTGLHRYYGVAEVSPNGTAIGTITFLTSEVYPHCLWIGKKISIQEGKRIVGCATVLRVMNPLLLKENT